MAKTKSKRVKYGFELNFPDTFTLKDLYAAKQHEVKYITLYSRVRKGIDEGTLAECGLKDPKSARRGRKEIVYRVIKNEEPELATADFAPPNAINW